MFFPLKKWFGFSAFIVLLTAPSGLFAQKASAEFISSIQPARLSTGEQAVDGIQSVYLKGTQLFVTNIWSGLQIVDVADVNNPKELGSFTTENRSHNCVVLGNTAYLSSEIYGVTILDVSNPAHITQLGHAKTKGDVHYVIAHGNYVYTAEELIGINIYDVSDPRKTVHVGGYDTKGFAWGLFLQDSTLYVADKNGGLLILDVSDPTRLKRLGAFTDMRYARTVQVEENKAYVSNGADGMWIIDVSNPAFPKLLSKITVDGYVYSLFKTGNSAFLANESKKRLDIVNVSDPLHPLKEGSYQSDANIYASWKSDVYVYIAADSKTIIVRHNHPPLIEPIALQKVDENQSLTIAPQAYDPDGDEIYFTIKNIPHGAVFDTKSGIINWTPTYDQSGTYPDVTIVVHENTESHLENQAKFNIIVKHVNRNPLMPLVADTTINEEQMVRFVLKEGSDPDVEDKGHLIYSAENMPAGARFEPKTRTFTWTPTYEQSGIYTVDFVLHDGAGGLMRDGATITVNHVDRKPILQTVNPIVANENTPVTFTLQGNDPDKEDQDKLSYSNGMLPDGATFNTGSATFNWTPTYDQSGDYDIPFTFTAGALSDSQIVHITVNHVNRPPVMDAIAAQTVNENDSLHFTITVSDPDVEDAGKLTVSTDQLPQGSNFDPVSNTFSWQPNYEQSGVYNKIQFTVSDPSGLTAAQKVQITVVHINRSPELQPIAAQVVDENKTLSFTLQGSDPDIEDKANLSYSVDKLPDGAILNGAEFSWKPTYDQSGNYQLVFTVSDGNLSVSQTTDITVNHVNRPPLFTPQNAQVVDENKALEFTVAASDPDKEDAGMVALSSSPLPQGATFDVASGTFTWTPTFDQAGDYAVTFSATDPQQATVEQPVKITVNQVNRTPVFPPQQAQTVDENTTLSFKLTPATDPDKEDEGKLAYTVDGLPDGATFDPATQALSWTPDFDQAGNYTLSFSVADAGFTVKQPLAITVNHVNRPPVVATIDDQTVDENQNWSVTVNASDPDKEDSGKLTVSVDNLPDGASFDAGSNTISWQTGFENAGNYTDITVSVKDPSGASASTTFNLTVNNINRKPVLTGPGSAELQEGQALNLSFTASDEDKDDLTFSLDGAPGGMRINSDGSLSWPEAQPGNFSVSVVVTDGMDKVSQKVNISVTPKPVPVPADSSGQ